MKIFLSYADGDRALALRLAGALSRSGAEVFTASEILPGDNWAEQISRALDESDAMIVLITRDSMNSVHVQREIDFALGHRQYKSRLIPVYVGKPEDTAAMDIPWVLKTFQSFHVDDPEQADAVVDEIARHLALSPS